MNSLLLSFLFGGSFVFFVVFSEKLVLGKTRFQLVNSEHEKCSMNVFTHPTPPWHEHNAFVKKDGRVKIHEGIEHISKHSELSFFHNFSFLFLNISHQKVGN